uniref:Fusion protein IQCJ-SCHIP1 N-terminal domain-containing protein n=1 Tax=Knipowitschia caucasica TaxID=637954 RepID=A0AAV2J407_KNICA
MLCACCFYILPQEQLKSLQSGLEQVDSGHFQLQSGHVTTDLDNMNMNLQPIETKVLIIQKAWRDFLQRQEVEKRSPSPPSLSSSSDKMSMSISMTTLSDGSTPAVQIDSLGKMEVDRSDRAASVLRLIAAVGSDLVLITCQKHVSSHMGLFTLESSVTRAGL